MPTDFELARSRAAHELEWMARGYEAWLMTPLLEGAKRIREIPDQVMSYDGSLIFIAGVCSYLATETPLYEYRGAPHPLTNAAERILQIPRDPREEPWCQRKDGILPSHIKD